MIPHVGGSQFDRERNAIQRSANLCDRRTIRFRQFIAGPFRCAPSEQVQSRKPHRFLERQTISRAWKRERIQSRKVLRKGAERLTTRRQKPGSPYIGGES